MNFDLAETAGNSAVIKVIGVGGGGGNAISHMTRADVDGVEFVIANTDSQALNDASANTTLQLGPNVTRGLGAGANPEVGRNAAMEDRETIAEAIQGSDMLFITAGMGGGTGTGAAPVVAEVAREMGILTVAVVTKPFSFEGRRRMRVAEEGIKALEKNVDSLIIIPNEKLLPVLGSDATLMQAFDEANNVLNGAVRGIADLIVKRGIINVDFADVRTVMSAMGQAMMGTGTASGPDRAIEATEKAIRYPLLEEIDLKGARGILVNITASSSFGLGEYTTIGDMIDDIADENAAVVIGTVIDDNMGDELSVTVVATGLDSRAELEVVQGGIQEQAQPQQMVANGGLSMPGILRPQAPVAATSNTSSGAGAGASLDVPTFLRRQAD
ncbi:cell division protein FtsZ [Litorivicinus lipolyticus]|uniref:Cell division protein FtsZ n=1 Tax=Litorivicinus lipolyticus TaxID=418701 RepID=A0A5Q2Q8E3_9GAMM|nr:cell division protein FtsZ [Litorivicinus lipolyticus]QGG80939.1 cell division protein FtsZ [Litorivicinus lipolyticus]